MKVPTFDDWMEGRLRNARFLRAYQRDLRAARLAVQIAQLRQQTRISQRELARKMGTSQQAIARLESGRYGGMSLTTLERVAEALKAELVVEIRRPKILRRKSG